MRGGCAGSAELHNASNLLYLDLGHHLEEETTVAIDGQIHETAYFRPIRPGCQIFFIPSSKGVTPALVPALREDD
jgi:hypothetical protein